MAELKADVLVLGAGMVGVGAALHLQQRGRDVILVDKHELAGEETSYGNAGMIECASVFPYMFPRDLGEILRYAMNRAPQVRYQFSDLPSFLPWLVRYFLASAPDRAHRGAMAGMAADRLDQNVPVGCNARQCSAGFRAGEAIRGSGRNTRQQGDYATRASPQRRIRRRDPFHRART